MIFGPAMLEQVLSGTKTVTQRYRPGRSYAVQPGRGMRGVGRGLVTDVRLEALGEITDAEALLEGFPDASAFLAYWGRLLRRAG